MTPPAAATAAGRRAAPAPSHGRRVAAPRPQRRVSGPARPARPVAVPRPARRPDLPLGARALDRLRTLPDHRLLDRLIGGRVWIVLIGGLLIGIVTLQLTLLRLNAGIGRDVERASLLQQQNAELRLTNSRLSDGERIAALATQMGFVTPPQGSPRFVTAGAGDAGRALVAMRVPAQNATTTTTPATTTPSASGTTTPVVVTGATTPTAPVAATTPATGQTTPATGATAPANGATAPTASQAPVVAGGASAPPAGGAGGQG